MKIKKFKISVWLVALSLVTMLTLALSSCTKEPLPSSEQSNKESTDFLLELVPPGAFTPAETRALSDDQQNSIKSATVLVFKDDILKYYSSYTVTDTQGVTKSVRVSLATSQSENELYDIMVIGNPPANFSFTAYLEKNKAELKAAFNVPLTKWAGEFIMYGEALKTLIKPTTNAFKIQMLRSLARVDIGVGIYNTNGTWGGLKDVFSLTEVLVVNTRSKFAVIPLVTTTGGNVKVSSPSVPTDATVQGTTATTAIKYPSTDISNGSYIKSTIFIAEAPNNNNRVTLLIGGSYKNSATTYYRIDMCVPKADGTGYDYLNILRNHLYRVSITNVYGAGFSNPQDALNADPINITTTLTPIEEGGSGDIIFDNNNSILTDVSSVLIYGTPNGVKSYNIATVTATFAKGVSATISGTGITQLNLTSGTKTTISYKIPDYETEGEYTIKVGQLTKVISFTVQPPVDAHFDVLPFENVASVTVENPQSWLTLSQNMKYVQKEQQTSSILGNSKNKAYLHFDENITTIGEPRTTRALVQRKNRSETTGVILEQLNLKGMVLGYFGDNDGNGSKMLLAIEALEECYYRAYDDTSIENEDGGIPWGFNGVVTDAADKVFGRASTIALVKRTDSSISGTYTIYHNYAARYCYDKNRGTGTNGEIQDKDVVWYLPAQNQLIGAWIVNEGIANQLNAAYWSATRYYKRSSWNVIFAAMGITFNYDKTTLQSIRCVRNLSTI